MKLSCFIAIGFPGETPATIQKTMSLGRRLAILGVHDVAVTKFVPYPGSDLFRALQERGKIKLDDEFFTMPMDFYTAKAPSYVEGMTSRYPYWTMMWMFLNFYAIAFRLRPWRFFGALIRVVQGRESTRFAKWLNDMFVVRFRWGKQAAKRYPLPAESLEASCRGDGS